MKHVALNTMSNEDLAILLGKIIQTMCSRHYADMGPDITIINLMAMNIIEKARQNIGED